MAQVSLRPALTAAMSVSITAGHGLDRAISDFIRLENRGSKGKSGARMVPITAVLEAELEQLRRSRWVTDRGYVIRTERGDRTSPRAIVNQFSKCYSAVGMEGCRGTFSTNAARKDDCRLVATGRSAMQ